MARTENEFRVTLSVLDRLLDYDPRESREAPRSRSASLRELRQSVRRDLEWLLNTRTRPNLPEEGLEEARRSVAWYGLRDLTGVAAKSQQEQNRLKKELESAISVFEPRFLDVKITLEPPDSTDRQLRFRIEARLDVDPTPEPIAFDSVLETGSGEFALIER
jgi:type VI secretion system protein ImpF